MKLARTFEQARKLRSGSVGLVPTMGFLHEGHLSLLAAAGRENDAVMMTLYVNPLQFDEQSDLDRYPRDLDRDLDLARAAGADVAFVPSPEEMFADAPATTVSLPDLALRMEGAHRPGHFDGVATVVAKLFGGLQPDRAYFGRKDAQQLAIVRRMTSDLSLPIEIVGAPIVREADRLALSSRNVFLGEEARRAALALSGGLFAAADLVEGGEIDGPRIEAEALEVMSASAGLSVEYAELAGQEEVERLEILDRPAFLAAAARVGDVRLIDNIHFDLASGGFVVDRGVTLSGPSILYGGA